MQLDVTCIDVEEHGSSVGAHVEEFVTFHDGTNDESRAFFRYPKTLGWHLDDGMEDVIRTDNGYRGNVFVIGSDDVKSAFAIVFGGASVVFHRWRKMGD